MFSDGQLEDWLLLHRDYATATFVHKKLLTSAGYFFSWRWYAFLPSSRSATISRRATVGDSLLDPQQSIRFSPSKQGGKKEEKKKECLWQRDRLTVGWEQVTTMFKSCPSVSESIISVSASPEIPGKREQNFYKHVLLVATTPQNNMLHDTGKFEVFGGQYNKCRGEINFLVYYDD